MRRGFLKTPKQPTNTQKPEVKEKDAASGTPDGQSGKQDEPKAENEELKKLPLFDPKHAPEGALKQYQASFHTETTRFIFREWPRDPKGKAAFTKGEQLGKQTPNGLLWGATLYDFYFVRPMPDVPSYLITTTGSRLADKMRQLGEVDYAKDELQWADQEAHPEQYVLPEQIALDIMPRENTIRMARGQDDGRMRSIRPKEFAYATEVPLAPPAADDTHYDIADIQPEHYPGPWPLVPFSWMKQGVKLETLVPYSLLPQKLIVHDPWKLLNMGGTRNDDEHANTDWTKMADIVHTYKLAPLTAAGQKKSEQQDQQFRNAIDDKDFVIFPDDPHAVASLPFMPPVRVKVPPHPHKTKTPAAHLYLSPAHKAGVGNHSAVYYAEWELPRALLVPDVLCRACINREIDESSEELQQMALDAIEKARESREPFQGDEEEFGYTETTEYVPPLYLGIAKSQTDAKSVPAYLMEPQSLNRHHTYHGPILEFHTKIQWQTPGRGPNCDHVRNSYAFMGLPNETRAPPTSVVRVCAKLSIEGDSHLAREAEVYQAFPAHLSQHWSGYNIVRPSREPVPVGAVVPQYYGYYLPANPQEEQYLSPIMLVEDCGQQVEPKELTADQRKECWSLMYRLHDADWMHHSPFERNILMQRGPLTVPQGWMRAFGTDLSFRLIDFGRSKYIGPEAADGEEDVYKSQRDPDWVKHMDDERTSIDEMMQQGSFSANHSYL